MSNGELVLQNGGTVNASSLQLTASVFKPTGTVSVTNGGTFALNGASSVVLKGDTTLNQAGSVSWPELDLGGNKLTLGSTVVSLTVQEALNIANGESLVSSGSSVINLGDTLTIANGGKLTSGAGNVQISDNLTLNGEIEQGGGILNLIKGGTVGATGKLDASDSDGVNFGSTLTIANGGKLTSGSGDVQISEALTLNGEIEQGGGILNLIKGGTVGATGRMDVGNLSLIHI